MLSSDTPGGTTMATSRLIAAGSPSIQTSPLHGGGRADGTIGDWEEAARACAKKANQGTY